MQSQRDAAFDERDAALAAHDAVRDERDAALQTIAHQSAQLDARDARIQALDRAIQLREIHNAALTAEVARLKRLQLAARTERLDPDQRQLFEETLSASRPLHPRRRARRRVVASRCRRT